VTAEPPTPTISIAPSAPVARAYSLEGRPISAPCDTSICSPQGTTPWRERWQASGPAAEPVAASSPTPSSVERREHPCLPARTRPGEDVHTEEAATYERAHVRSDGGDGLLALEPDVDMLQAVVVDLNRQRGAFDPKRGK